MEPFKNIFSPEMVAQLAHHLGRQMSGFEPAAFVGAIVPRLDALELKARAQLIADHIHAVLPSDHPERARILLAMLHPDELDYIDKPSTEEGVSGWAILPLTLVVGQHGVADFDRSMMLLMEMTKRFSSEFAIRYFLLHDQPRALAILREWVDDPNCHVRRLVSEGTRPRLPWAMQLPDLIRDPTPVLPLLTRLRDDPEPYVRRSVANHLNDIAKDHPGLVNHIAREWMREPTAARTALLRHACRTLIKKGDPETLSIFGYGAPAIETGELKLSAARITMGDRLEMEVTLQSTADREQRLAVDYVLHFLKANGDLKPKVFKGSIVTLAPGETRRFNQRHRFMEVTTRKHYPGRHAVCLRINGRDTGLAEFELL